MNKLFLVTIISSYSLTFVNNCLAAVIVDPNSTQTLDNPCGFSLTVLFQGIGPPNTLAFGPSETINSPYWKGSVTLANIAPVGTILELEADLKHVAGANLCDNAIHSPASPGAFSVPLTQARQDFLNANPGNQNQLFQIKESQTVSHSPHRDRIVFNFSEQFMGGLPMDSRLTITGAHIIPENSSPLSLLTIGLGGIALTLKDFRKK